ncbi:LysR family transcriptional regulator [Aquibacillus sediminis]|uniref:LysR family transcriptional regulator n=1 Tax=Aquibacillus sediminis TaxID=2574734 RepID=UPI001107F8E7|nr:LysR family transcriptional regulator [Aquibacillus sediminis]
MDLRQLRYFYTIAKEGQITRAANKLHMAQPPLSTSLKELETELGVSLFERNRKKMELTEPGLLLYEKAEKLFEYLDETVMEVKETGDGLRGTLSIGCVKTCFSHMPKRLKTFRTQYPNITYELMEGDSYFLADQLMNRSIDLALVRLPLEMKDFEYVPLPDENYVVVIPNSWAEDFSTGKITMANLVKLPLLLLHRLSGIGQYEVILDKFHKNNLQPKVVCQCPDVDILLELVREGLGASIVPTSALTDHQLNGIKKLMIEDENIVSKSAIIWLKNRYLSKSARQFIELFHA